MKKSGADDLFDWDDLLGGFDTQPSRTHKHVPSVKTKTASEHQDKPLAEKGGHESPSSADALDEGTHALAKDVNTHGDGFDLAAHTGRAGVIQPVRSMFVPFLEVQSSGARGDVKQMLQPYEHLVGVGMALQGNPEGIQQLAAMVQSLPWLDKAIKAIVRADALNGLKGQAGFHLARPLLLVGEPGIGKSWLTQQIARLAEVPHFTIAAAGKADNMALRGAARGWHSARPGELVEFIMEKRCPNPLVIVDEIDKVATGTHNGNLQHTLLQLLEPTNACQWRDEFLLGQVDLSRVSWIATANSTETIPEPLLSRMLVVHLQGPRNDAERRLMLHSLAWDMAREYGLGERHQSISPWPVFLRNETFIQTVLNQGRNYRDYRRNLEAIVEGFLRVELRYCA